MTSPEAFMTRTARAGSFIVSSHISPINKDKNSATHSNNTAIAQSRPEGFLTLQGATIRQRRMSAL